MPPIDPPADLTKELVQHLSKEIETLINSMMLFRTRIGFSLLVGPFVLLGSFIIGAKGQSINFNLSQGWPALLVIIICYLGIAYIASRIEETAWNQCNKWRGLIETLRRNPSFEIAEEDLKPGHKAKSAYLLGYFLLFVSVIAAFFMIKNMDTPKSANTGATFRIEQTTP